LPVTLAALETALAGGDLEGLPAAVPLPVLPGGQRAALQVVQRVRQQLAARGDESLEDLYLVVALAALEMLDDLAPGVAHLPRGGDPVTWRDRARLVQQGHTPPVTPRPPHHCRHCNARPTPTPPPPWYPRHIVR
jgi:hypothetical protein